MTDFQETLVLDSDPSQVPDLQSRLLEMLNRQGFDELAAFRMTCALIEAVNNCIEHAYGGLPGNPIKIRWTRLPESITAEVRDQGRPMPTEPLEQATMPVEHAESGRGWPIIRQWTDGLSYTREAGENVLKLEWRKMNSDGQIPG